METNMEEYRNFYHEKNVRDYQKREAIRVGEVSYDALDNDDYNEDGKSIFCDELSESFEDKMIYKILSEQLPDALSILNEEEYRLITQIYYEGKSERELSAEYGVTCVAIHKRKEKIIKKLQKFFQ